MFIFVGDTKSSKENLLAHKKKTGNNFICFLCHVEHLNSKEDVLYASSVVAAGHPYFPFLIKMNPPRGGRCLSSRGTVQVCQQCCSTLCAQWHKYETQTIPLEERIYCIGDLTFSMAQAIQTGLAGSRSDLPNKQLKLGEQKEFFSKEVCYLCSKICKKDVVKYMNSRKSDADKSVPFYPFITQLERPQGAHCIDEAGRVLACMSCSAYLHGQWMLYETKNISLFTRTYIQRPVTENKPTGDEHPSDIAG